MLEELGVRIKNLVEINLDKNKIRFRNDKVINGWVNFKII